MFSLLLKELIFEFYYTGYVQNIVEYGFVWHTRATNFRVNSAILSEIELDGDVIPVQVICKMHENPVKVKQGMFRTRSIMGVFGTKEKVSSESMVRLGWCSNLSDILCMYMLSASFN